MRITTSHYDVGGAAIDNHGSRCRLRRLKVVSKPMPCCLAGRWSEVGTFAARPATRTRRMLPLRKHFKLFSNLRPAKLYRGWKHSVRCVLTLPQTALTSVCARTDRRHLFRSAKRPRRCGQYEKAFDTEVYHRFEIERLPASHLNLPASVATKSPQSTSQRAAILYFMAGDR